MTIAITISLLTEFRGIHKLVSLPHVLKLTPERSAGPAATAGIVFLVSLITGKQPKGFQFKILQL